MTVTNILVRKQGAGPQGVSHSTALYTGTREALVHKRSSAVEPGLHEIVHCKVPYCRIKYSIQYMHRAGLGEPRPTLVHIRGRGPFSQSPGSLPTLFLFDMVVREVVLEQAVNGAGEAAQDAALSRPRG